ncbi:M20/M25/M40 family metallo-hydrolase [Lentibacillus sediminis]|uniref:M20/M25/M40 family metallo-hydrolase n=1 Tax=Lentibacillus sediminis TaxID=1940529 RepID=UPI001EFD30B2|nr:M20/M25/M40 family metallo-hydrolase [Lentibacillus sediminis]
MDKEQAKSFLKEIIQINSVNPPGNETEVANKLKGLFDEHGIETELVEYDENRTNLIAHLKGKEEGPVLGLTGHMDVVPPGEIDWEHDPFAADEADGKIYGRGASDMKSGLAACVLAMVALKEEGLPQKGEITLLATVGEEAGAVGARQLTEKGYADKLDALIVGEPTDNLIKNAHKGALWLQLITYGQTAHGSMPEYQLIVVNI